MATRAQRYFRSSRARSPGPRRRAFAITTVDGDQVSARYVDAEGFLADNAHDEALCDACRALRVGQEAEFGGGAAPRVTVRRIS